MSNDISSLMWRRLKYFLSPQLDLYKYLNKYTEGKFVLEAGFGTGGGTLQYAYKTAHTTAWEIDRQAIEFAKDMWGDNILWEIGDITEDTRPRKFDVIIAIEVLEHIPRWDLALENIRFTLADDGVAIISGPNANADLRKNPNHEQEWTAKEFKENLKKYFYSVQLMDWTLSVEQGESTALTPLVAVCTGTLIGKKQVARKLSKT